ncbi:hypothetical protein FC18_GL001999 [Lacticaseibacillus sharpeae JCM 1186 = DSM 20505]|uniref:Uncharacterized protein n=1 Tax=Lacticaseibacillus sharpeae JCM 1186 = DSM 20505 TaxID=1291052 RepID=A0A0R1ZQ07_9LACO|nr:hypothetical protein FC18_GL001999 [Lacticaseibacillus sharpeae JCM 1186 = DSM 20505]
MSILVKQKSNFLQQKWISGAGGDPYQSRCDRFLEVISVLELTGIDKRYAYRWRNYFD